MRLEEARSNPYRPRVSSFFFVIFVIFVLKQSLGRRTDADAIVGAPPSPSRQGRYSLRMP